MFALTVHQLTARKRRAVGAGLAIVLGVAFLFATLAVGDTMRSGFDTLYDEANAGTDVVVRNERVLGGDDDVRVRDALPADLAATLDGVAGVEAVVPVVDGIAQLAAADGSDLGGDGPPTLASSWIDDDIVNPFQLVDGRPPRPVPAGEPIEVVIDRGSARDGDLVLGAETFVKLPARQDVVVVGIAAFGDLDSLGPSTWVSFDADTAASLLLDDPSEVSSFALRATEGVDATQLRDVVATAVPAGVETLTGAELTAEQVADVEGDFVGFIRLFLLAFALVAVLVSTFSIHNTFTILVAQRMRESALLRAVGASRRQVLASTIGEAAIIGVVASAIGLAVGWGIGLVLRAALAAGGIELPGSGLVVTRGAVIAAVACGVVVTLVASLTPAVRAARVAPLAALRDAAVDRSGIARGPAVVGGLMIAAGVGLAALATSTSDGAFVRAGIGASLVVVGSVVAGAVLVRPAIAVLGAPVRWLRGERGRMADRNARRNPRRTSATASALMVGVAVVVLFTVLASSVVASIEQSVDRTFGGDLVIVQDSFSGASIDPVVAAELAALDEVTAVGAMAVGPALIDGIEGNLTAVDPDRFASVLDVGVAEGSLADLDRGQFAASRDRATERGWSVGDEIPLAFADGTSTTVELAALYTEADIAGPVLVDVADVPRAAGFQGDVAIMIDLAPGVGQQRGAAAVDAVAGALGAPEAQTRDEYMDTVVSQIQTFLGIVYGLLAVAVVIALMGIANTLALSIHERTRELGLLRALGQTRSELRSSVRWESVLIAVFGTVGGVVVGTFLGWTLVRAISAQEGFGVFTVPVGSLLTIMLVGALAGTLAAARPARRAARVDIIAALGSA
jgi:putative ABC transport system permease protein